MARSSTEPAIAPSHVLMSKNSSIGSPNPSAFDDEAADQRAGDAEQGCDDDAAGILSGQEGLGDQPGEQAEDDPAR